MVQILKKKSKGPAGGKRKSQTFTIDCTKPVEDKIMEIGKFEKFLIEKIKVDGKTGTPLVGYFPKSAMGNAAGTGQLVLDHFGLALHEIPSSSFLERRSMCPGPAHAFSY